MVNADGQVLHSGSWPEKLPRLIAELLEHGRTSPDHPLIVSSATHFLIEHIHPFRNGNGRIGRLWQTLILSR
ncbi:MAG: Fic family protein [Propionibacteriaceae bacterium]|nr:Fic family protein [Propionibacteriaceae bacterium]